MKKEILIEKTTNKLLGKTAAEEKAEAKVRNRVWYGRWDEIADFLLGKPKPTEKEILKRMHFQLTDEEKAIRSDFIIRNDGIKLIIPQVLEIHRILSEVSS